MDPVGGKGVSQSGDSMPGNLVGEQRKVELEQVANNNLYVIV
jgi:hypothetical protein